MFILLDKRGVADSEYDYYVLVMGVPRSSNDVAQSTNCNSAISARTFANGLITGFIASGIRVPNIFATDLFIERERAERTTAPVIPKGWNSIDTGHD